MIHTRTVALAILSVLSTACVGEHLINVSVDDAAGSNVPAWFEVGDSIRLKAAEYIIEGNGEPDPPSSTSAPGRYSWRSYDPRVATFTDLGRLRMLDTGQTRVEVKTSTASTTFTINVVPRIATLRVRSDSGVISVGGAATARIDPLDASGSSIPYFSEYRTLHSGYNIDLLVLTLSGPTDVVSIAPPAGYGEWTVRGLKSGTATIVARSILYDSKRTGDTLKIVVR